MKLGDVRVLALVGAQYGSEGKGVIAQHLAPEFGIHIRTGGPNAGHTYHHLHRDWVARTVPVGWINPDAICLIGPGAIVDVQLLGTELAEIAAVDETIYERVVVDPRAHVLHPVRHHALEGGVDGKAHREIGSTGEGVGPCRMAKLARTTFPSDYAWAKAQQIADVTAEDGTLQFEQRPLFGRGWLVVDDTSKIAARAIARDVRVLLEGTQGSGLSVTHGPWPYVTSADTNAAQLAADAGIPPQHVQTMLVARTFPIRVAGNSGPLKGEVTFEEIGAIPEYTTVTKKQRRIGLWDQELFERACLLNHPRWWSLTFADYLEPTARGATSLEQLPESVWTFINQVQARWNESAYASWGSPLDCALVSTGPAGTPILEMPV